MTQIPSTIGDPDRAILPDRGLTEETYLTAFPNRGAEFCDGRIEALPMPTEEHQTIVAFLYEALVAFVRSRDLGKVLFSGLRVRVRPDRLREPDVVFMSSEHDDRRENKFWRGADLAMEVVSEVDPQSDHTVKREEYAQAGIDEYWIVDPRTRTIAVLTLPEGAAAYVESGEYAEGSTAESVLLDGFRVDVTAAFAGDQ